MRSWGTPILLVFAFAQLAATTARGQLALLPGNLDEAHAIQVLVGEVDVSSLTIEKTALVFFSPAGCAACEEFLSYEPFLKVPPVRMVLVTNADDGEIEEWVDAHPGWNVWLDSRDELAMLLGVKEVPSVYMIDAGAVVNADYWPFWDGLDGLLAELEYFANASPTPRPDEIVKGLLGVEIGRFLRSTEDSPNTSHSQLLIEEAVVVVCWHECSVCNESANYFHRLYLDNPRLPPLVVISVTDDLPPNLSPGLSAWSQAGFVVHEIGRMDAGYLDLPVSPVVLIVDSAGVVVWASVGFSSNLGESILDWMAVP